MDRLQTIASYRDLPLAELTKAKLESEGIFCFLTNKHHIGLNWLYSFALGGVKVQVKSEDSETAIEILKADQSANLSDIEDSFPSLEKNDICTECGSSNLELLDASRKAGAFSLLFGLPLIFFKKRYKCLDCGCKIK